MRTKYQKICLVDCDSFFVACEVLDNPDLRGKSVCVTSGNVEKGIVISRSKEAKDLGIKMGEPVFLLDKYKKNTTFIAARHERYREISKNVMRTLSLFSPDVEKVSIDEAFVNITGLDAVYKKSYVELIKEIKEKILQEAGVPVSVGLSSSKTLAKLAGDLAKANNGIYVIQPQKVIEKIGGLEIDKVSGVGKQKNMQLKLNGIFTIKDYLAKDDRWIRQKFGIVGLSLKHELEGVCVSAIEPMPKAPKAIQETSSFDEFSGDKNFLLTSIAKHFQDAARRMREWDGYAKNIGIMLRGKDFSVCSAKISLDVATNSSQEMMKEAPLLLNKIYQPNKLYRSCGVFLDDIKYQDFEQLSLFDEKVNFKDCKIARSIDKLEEKFGKNVVKSGWL